MAESEWRRDRARGEAGFTLMESLIAVVIVTTVVLAGAMAFFGMQRSTAADSGRVKMDLALSAYAEALKAVPFVTCASSATSSYSGVVWPQPAGITASITGVSHYRGTTSAMATCAVGAAQDSRQIVTVTVSYGSMSLATDIVKRAAGACPQVSCSW